MDARSFSIVNGASTVVGHLTGYRILAFELTLIIVSSLKKAASVKRF